MEANEKEKEMKATSELPVEFTDWKKVEKGTQGTYGLIQCSETGSHVLYLIDNTDYNNEDYAFLKEFAGHTQVGYVAHPDELWIAVEAADEEIAAL
tara:strand:- start:7603 stop:7890 length:288 start_codon:yes stop_codon:yes gene_type:complete